MKRLFSLVVSLTLILSFTLTPNFTADLYSADNRVTLESDGNYHSSSSGSQITNIIDSIYTINTDKSSFLGLFNLSSPKSQFIMKVSDNTYVPVEEIHIDLMNVGQVENTITRYNINKYLANDLLNLSAKFIDGSITSNSPEGSVVKYYVPLDLNKNKISISAFASPSPSYSRRTYTGYNNAQYFEELVVYPSYQADNKTYILKANAGKQEIMEKLDNLISRGVMTGAGIFIDAGTGGLYSLATVFGLSAPEIDSASVGTYSYVEVEEKVINKFTSIMKSDGYHVGSIESKSTYRFEHSLYISGSGNGKQHKYGSWKTQKSPYYSNADYKAYKGWTNPIDNKIKEYGLEIDGDEYSVRSALY